MTLDPARMPAGPARLAPAAESSVPGAAAAGGGASARAPAHGLEGRASENDGFLRRIVARSGACWVVVPTDSIRWIEARGKYLWLHCGSESYRLRSTVHELVAQLDPEDFFRVHRSTIVRLDEVCEFAGTRQGDFRIRLRDGAQVLLTRDRRRQFLAALEGGGGAQATA